MLVSTWLLDIFAPEKQDIINVTYINGLHTANDLTLLVRANTLQKALETKTACI